MYEDPQSFCAFRQNGGARRRLRRERAGSRWRARANVLLERGAVITRLRRSCGARRADFGNCPGALRGGEGGYRSGRIGESHLIHRPPHKKLSLCKVPRPPLRPCPSGVAAGCGKAKNPTSGTASTAPRLPQAFPPCSTRAYKANLFLNSHATRRGRSRIAQKKRVRYRAISQKTVHVTG